MTIEEYILSDSKELIIIGFQLLNGSKRTLKQKRVFLEQLGILESVYNKNWSQADRIYHTYKTTVLPSISWWFPTGNIDFTIEFPIPERYNQ